jgi:hypothetical protein
MVSFQSEPRSPWTSRVSKEEPNPILKNWEPRAPVFKGRNRWMSQLKQRENFSFLHLFVWFRSQVNWICEEVTLLSLLNQILISSRNTFIKTHGNSVSSYLCFTSPNPADIYNPNCQIKCYIQSNWP